MRLLAIESSSLVASAAILEDDRILAEYTTDHRKTHSQTLLPMIDEIVRMTQTELESLDAIAVSCGPGSFTGLRIGAATAKGLAMTLDIPVVAVPTLDAQAYGLCICGVDMKAGKAADESAGAAVGVPEAAAGRANIGETVTGRMRQDWAPYIVCPIMDARRNQVYTGLYHTDAGVPERLIPCAAMDIRELLAELEGRGEQVVFMGDGVPVYSDVIDKECRVPYAYAPPHLARQRAGAVAALGAIYYREGRTTDADTFAPEYLRKSQAEREREEAGTCK